MEVANICLISRHYVEMIFPGYGMDIEYNKYIPEEYLPEGLDISEGNPTRLKKIENY